VEPDGRGERDPEVPVSDDHARVAERRARATGHGDDEVRALAARIRAGRVTPERAALAAVLGHQGAANVLGPAAGDPCHVCRRPTRLGLCIGACDAVANPVRKLLHTHLAPDVLTEALVRAAVAAAALSWGSGWAWCACLQCETARREGLKPEDVAVINRYPTGREPDEARLGRDPAMWMCSAALQADNVASGMAILVEPRPEGREGARWDMAWQAAQGYVNGTPEPLLVPLYADGDVPAVDAIRALRASRAYAAAAQDAGFDLDAHLQPRRSARGNDAAEEVEVRAPVEFTGDGSEVVVLDVPAWRNASLLLRAHAPVREVEAGRAARGEAAARTTRPPLWAWHVIAAVHALLDLQGRLPPPTMPDGWTSPGRRPRDVSWEAGRDARRWAVDALVLAEFERRTVEPANGPAWVFARYPESVADGLRVRHTWDAEARTIGEAVMAWALAT